jgi:hypothetical protein
VETGCHAGSGGEGVIRVEAPRIGSDQADCFSGALDPCQTLRGARLRAHLLLPTVIVAICSSVLVGCAPPASGTVRRTVDVGLA